MNTYIINGAMVYLLLGADHPALQQEISDVVHRIIAEADKPIIGNPPFAADEVERVG